MCVCVCVRERERERERERGVGGGYKNGTRAKPLHWFPNRPSQVRLAALQISSPQCPPLPPPLSKATAEVRQGLHDASQSHDNGLADVNPATDDTAPTPQLWEVRKTSSKNQNATVCTDSYFPLAMRLWNSIPTGAASSATTVTLSVLPRLH